MMPNLVDIGSAGVYVALHLHNEVQLKGVLRGNVDGTLCCASML